MDDLDFMFGEDEESPQQQDNNQDIPTNGEKFSTIRVEECSSFAFHNGTELSMFIHLEKSLKSYDSSNCDPSKESYDLSKHIDYLEFILNKIDEFCYSVHWMMHLGDEKKKEIEKRVSDELKLKILSSNESSLSLNAFNVMELGSYCGYSAIVLVRCFLLFQQEFGQKFPQLLSSFFHLFSIEAMKECCDFTNRLVNICLVSNYVTVVHAKAEEVEKYTSYFKNGEKVDLLLLDHDKMSYLNDLKLLLKQKILREGSLIFADNIMSHNILLSDYVNFVENNTPCLFTSSFQLSCKLEYTLEKDKDNEKYVDALEITRLSENYMQALDTF